MTILPWGKWPTEASTVEDIDRAITCAVADGTLEMTLCGYWWDKEFGAMLTKAVHERGFRFNIYSTCNDWHLSVRIWPTCDAGSESVESLVAGWAKKRGG